MLCAKENCSVKTRQSELLRYALIMAMLLISGSVFVALRRWGTESVPFSKAGWKYKADWGERWSMAKRFVETGCLNGMTESEVIEMLGDDHRRGDREHADSSGDKGLTYFVCGRFRYGVLIISFKNGRVAGSCVVEQ